MNEKEESILDITDVSAETMKVFLQFIYKDKVEPEYIDQNLLFAVDKYNIKRLVNICVKYFENTINITNVMEITFVAYLINNDALLEKASKFIFQNHGKIKKPEEWDQIKKTHPNIATKVIWWIWSFLIINRHKDELFVPFFVIKIRPTKIK